MADSYLGEIRMFGFNFPPREWGFCNGGMLAIGQNTALFAIIGTTYGGDGRTTMALPELQGRAPMGFGQGPGLTQRFQGQPGGEPGVYLNESQLPGHDHTLYTRFTTDQAAVVDEPTNNFLSRNTAISNVRFFLTSPPGTGQSSMEDLGSTGGSQPHENRQPYIAVNFCMSLAGIFPSRS